MRRSTWHTRVGAVVALWLVALIAVAVVGLVRPVNPWLLVHLLLLGAVSSAILIWSAHFADALLRLPDGNVRTGDAMRLGLFNCGALAVIAGMLAGVWVAVVGGAVLTASAVAWHGGSLLRRRTRALPSRFGSTVSYYVTAAALLPIGIALGAIMAPDTMTESTHVRFAVAHVAVNLLGWIGLTVVGTLVTLWPTMLRTRVADGAERIAGQALPVLAASVLVAAGGALVDSRAIVVAGLCGYLAGLAMSTRPLVAEAVSKPPTTYATWSVLAGWMWLVGSIAALAAIVAVSPDWSQVAETADQLAAPLLIGFAAQTLLGALSYLIPVVLGGGPSIVRATNRALATAGPARVTIVNAGIVGLLLPLPGAVRALVAAVVLLTLASFLPLAGWAVLVARRSRAPATAP